MTEKEGMLFAQYCMEGDYFIGSNSKIYRLIFKKDGDFKPKLVANNMKELLKIFKQNLKKK